MWQFANDHEFIFAFLVCSLATAIANLIWKMWNRWMRHRTILKQGWPPEYVDADGDPVAEESNDERSMQQMQERMTAIETQLRRLPTTISEILIQSSLNARHSGGVLGRPAATGIGNIAAAAGVMGGMGAPGPATQPGPTAAQVAEGVREAIEEISRMVRDGQMTAEAATTAVRDMMASNPMLGRHVPDNIQDILNAAGSTQAQRRTQRAPRNRPPAPAPPPPAPASTTDAMLHGDIELGTEHETDSAIRSPDAGPREVG